MFKENDVVVYKRDVCKITGTKQSTFNGKDYFILKPIDDKSLTIQVPVENSGNLLRKVITKEEIELVIDKIPIIEPLADNKYIENDYKDLLNNGTHEDLIKIIKTAYLRNQIRKEAGKKIAERDNNYFQMAERILYNEFSIGLGKTIEETKQYIIDKVINQETIK